MASRTLSARPSRSAAARERREALSEQVLAVAEDLLATQPLSKPSDHVGGGELDMHRLQCPAGQRKQIVDAIVAAKEAGLTTSGTRERGLRGFEEAWREYSAFPDSPP